MDNYVFKKPVEVPEGMQLFSSDLNKDGAKKFIITTHKKVYNNIIKSEDSYFYEDHTFNNKIKLHIDIDYNKIFNSYLERDKLADKILDDVLSKVNNKIKSTTLIEPQIIILISDTLKKLSLHIIYVNIVLSSIFEMKLFFTNVSSYIDMNIYKRGCFRLLGCSKLGKNNKLVHYKSINYDYVDEYQLFLDSSITYAEDTLSNIIKYENSTFETKDVKYKNSRERNHAIKTINRNYNYRNYDLDKVQESLDLLENNMIDYSFWLTLSFAIRDLWLGIEDENDKNKLYKMFDKVCSKFNNYDKSNNKKIFLQLNPVVDINYLFNLTGNSYFIHPFYDYNGIIFNLDKHKNVIKQDSKYIDVDVSELIKYNLIFLKSPTGTGKTTILKQILSNIKLKNVISITSRVNLAGEHVKNLNLQFYKELDTIDFKYCNNLVIQLESIYKCNYNLFKNGVVILDEINSLLSHLRSPTFNNKRSECYNYLVEIIKNAKYVISLDADLSDWNIDFIHTLRQDEYIVYQNICKNKLNIPATFYSCDQVMLNVMEEHMKNNKYFVACFDSLTNMKLITNYLSKYKTNDNWLEYSSEVDYGLIDTKTWTNKYVFFTPTIIYGIDYNELLTDVFCFVHKFHLNPLQIYQMISRVRKINKTYVYCHTKLFYLKYKSIDDVIH